MMGLFLSAPNWTQGRRRAVTWQSGRRRKQELSFTAAASGIHRPTQAAVYALVTA